MLLAWLIALLLRAVLRSGGGRAGDREPAPEHVAYLTGGPRQAVYAAVTALRSAGSVRAADGKIYASGPLPRGAGGLASAIHHAVQGGMPVAVLPTHPAVRAELDRAADQLRGQGVLLSRGRRWAMGLTTVPLFVLALFGGARFALNLPSDDSAALAANLRTMLTLVCAILALILSVVVASRAQIRTRGANRLVHDLRRRYAALAPRHNPSLTVNGPAAATLAVGLFGTAALWTADPAFAGAANVAEQHATRGAVDTAATVVTRTATTPAVAAAAAAPAETVSAAAAGSGAGRGPPSSRRRGRRRTR
ncbi:TIGR04222 domain-containing membrane protein [Dactylosporangium sp. NPDC049525]|uniref:TIGR04222 domain-containing membrane protein n=1 Tax=Dactylosporangium sp. NPDC049525 TaxID=3154730 RepID=UPI00342C0906